MRTLSLRALCLLSVLATQTFAQRFTASEPDTLDLGVVILDNSPGYDPNYRQAAVLGEKNSIYANLMLVGGRNVVPQTNDITGADIRSSYKVLDSYGNEFGDIWPIPLNSELSWFKNANGDSICDNVSGAVAVLDSFSDNKKTALVLFATLKKLIVTELRINSLGLIEYSILKNLEMPGLVNQDKNINLHGRYIRLAFLGTSYEGSVKVYHIAVSNPNYKNGTYSGSGRIDFFSIKEHLWTLAQPNANGIVSGSNIFNQNTALGIDIVSVGDLNGNGYNDLAVLFSASEHFANGAVYIFFMESESVPNLTSPVTLAGETMPWKEDRYNDRTQDCRGMSFTTWKDEPHLLLSCNAIKIANDTNTIAFIKDIILDSSGNIASTSIFSETKSHNTAFWRRFGSYSNPIPIKNHKNNGHSVALPINGPCEGCSIGNIYIYKVADADASKNFSIEAGQRETLANIDSLFYRGKTNGYSAKTLAGLAKCRIQNTSELSCETAEEATSSWSMVELNSNGVCEPYRICKKKDTVYVYARAKLEAENTALRIPKDIVMPKQSGSFAIENISSLAYFKNPGNFNTGISWSKAGLKFSAILEETNDRLSITPLPHDGTDSIAFSLSVYNSTNKHFVRLHVADTSKILKNAIPGNDTIWNTAQKKYIALPLATSNGSIYTYDITQDSLGIYAEILGDYLHILKVEVANIYIAYTENSERKYRKITLMPEPKALPLDPPEQEPVSIATAIQAQNLKAMRVNGGLQISGLNGEFELRSYNFKGVEIQREKASAQGSAFVKLRQNCPQIVQIKSAEEKIYFSIFPIYGAP